MRPLLCFLSLLLAATPALADNTPQPPILVWGVHRGCTPLSDLEREVQRGLEVGVTKPWAKAYVLSPPARQLGCEGTACAQLVQRACPAHASKSQLLGGRIEQNKSKTITRMRLWLHDWQTGQTAYHDNWCSGCSLTNMVQINANHLAQNPVWGPTPGPIPTYCNQRQPTEQPPHSNTIFWTVFGRDQHKATLTATIRRVAQEVGTESALDQPVKTLPEFKRATAKDPGAQILGAEIQGGGNIELFLFDGPTARTEVQRIECPACDKDELSEKLRQSARLLLTHCFTENCAGRVAYAPAPADACVPFDALQCGEGSGVAMTTANVSMPDASGPEISPRLASITKGVLWGLVGVGAATTATLLAMNYSSLGTVIVDGQGVRNSLLPGAATAGALTALTLGVAIPMHIVLSSATAPRSSSASFGTNDRTASSSLQCPN